MKKVILLIMLSIMITSCYDEDIVDPSKVEGKLTIIIYGKDQLPSKNTMVSVKTQYGKTIAVDFTNEYGQFDVLLLEGNYYIETKIYEDNIYFIDNKYLQIIGGLNKVLELKPFENVGEITRVVLDSKRKPIPGINVALLTKVLSNGTTYTFEQCKQLAYITGITDAEGIISFPKIPIGYTFGVLIYRDESFYEYYPHHISVEEEGDMIYTNLKQ